MMDDERLDEITVAAVMGKKISLKTDEERDFYAKIVSEAAEIESQGGVVVLE